jgi:hypothetical protein
MKPTEAVDKNKYKTGTGKSDQLMSYYIILFEENPLNGGRNLSFICLTLH